MMSRGHDNTETQPFSGETKSFGDEASSINANPSSIHRWYDFRHNTFFSCYLIVTVIMTIWPWIFFGVVYGLHGINIDSSVVEGNPRDTLYFVTVISGIIGLITAHLFSKGVASLARKRVVYKDTAISDVSFFTALRNRAPTRSLFRQGRPHRVIMVIFFLVIFALITPGLTALLTPIYFIRSVPLQGHELDFGSEDTECVNWFINAPPIQNTCDWSTFNGLEYTDCLVENQLVDVLESGRGNILSSIKGPNVSIAYIQLGAPGGLHFFGSIAGLLPIGPNGIPAFNTLDERSNAPFPNADSGTNPTYNYTLNLQGVSSNVKCISETESPVDVTVTGGIYQSIGSCPPGSYDISGKSGASFVSIGSNNTLASWTCQPAENSYTVYIRGFNHYRERIGNITCTISSIQPTVFPLKYTGQSDIFTAQSPIQNSSSPVNQLTWNMVRSIGSVIWEAQTLVANSVAESIFTLGIKAFTEAAYAQNEKYLELYESMIKGILEYEATYIRLLYSTQVNESTPQSCMRNITGSADLQKFGWSSTGRTAAYLLPLTLINITTIIVLIIAMHTGANILPIFDPTDPESLILSHDASGVQLLTVRSQPDNLIPWRNLVAFGRNKDDIYRLWPKDEVVSEEGTALS